MLCGQLLIVVLSLCQNIGLETMMHLTCTNMPRSQIDDALRTAKAAGIQNILALRYRVACVVVEAVC